MRFQRLILWLLTAVSVLMSLWGWYTFRFSLARQAHGGLGPEFWIALSTSVAAVLLAWFALMSATRPSSHGGKA